MRPIILFLILLCSCMPRFYPEKECKKEEKCKAEAYTDSVKAAIEYN